MVYLHQELARGRWFELTIFEQMGNIGSEVGRAAKWRRLGDGEKSQAALYRALDLCDLTAADPRWRKKRRLREILRARELVSDFFLGGNFYDSTDEFLEKYFMQFALAARKHIS